MSRPPHPSARSAPSGALARHPETIVFLGAVALALAAALLGAAPGPAVLVAAAALAATAGLPHGALDPLVARQAGLTPTPARRAVFLAAYTSLAALVVLAWLAAPAVTLAGFIAVSAWHFGGDWFEGRAFWRLAAGLALLSLPAALHGVVTGDIYVLLSGEPARAIAEIQAGLAPLWIAALLLAALAAVQRSRRAAVEIFTAGLAALVLHPLLFFALYFALLHSAKHFRGLWRAAPDRRGFVRAGAVYTGLSLLGAGLAFVVLSRSGALDESILRVVFIGLAALTAPHMAVIEWARARQAGLPLR